MAKIWTLKKSKKWLLSSLVIVALIVSGATYAYNQHLTRLDNFLNAEQVSAEIIENGLEVGEVASLNMNLGGETLKEVRFRNTGSAGVFVRVSFAETWTGREQWLSSDNDYVELNWTNAWEDEWEEGEDGWYYYKKVLLTETETNEVLSSVTFKDYPEVPLDYINANYQLFFSMEVVQYSEETAVNDDVLRDVFRRSATVIDGNVTWN